MHSYPAWKVWLVAIVLLISAVLALPNVYGDAPALQLSRNDRSAGGEADRGTVTALLAGKNIPIESSYLSEDRLVLRFHTVEQQLAARDVLQESHAEDYLVALSQVPGTPGWVRALGLKPMSLGLDLRGGVHFLYEVDVGGAGRTDAGVHASGQVAHLRIRKAAEPIQITRKLNDLLPHDIHVLNTVRAADGYHARHDAESRVYLYQISRRRAAFA